MSGLTWLDLSFEEMFFTAPLLDDTWRDYMELQIIDFPNNIIKLIFIPHVS